MKLLAYICTLLFIYTTTLPKTFAQNITTLAGNGTAGYSGDGGPASAAQLNNPYGVAADTAGNIYIADNGNNRIRKVNAAGIISTIAGTGAAGYSGDRGQATAARIQAPRGITLDPAGNVVFSDRGNNVVRKIDVTTGIITTIAGTGGSPAFTGDGGLATAARLGLTWGVAYDRSGNLYLADDQNCRVRMVNTSGIINTICGTGICFSGGDGGTATAALVQYPVGVAIGYYNNHIYIADDGNNRIREINTSNIISTLAGSPTYGFTGDGGPSTAARLYYPKAVATDDSGNVYIADQNNNRIRKIDTFGNINTIAGNGTATYGGDNGPATAASLNQPTGIAIISRFGRVYICDNLNNRIRVIDNFHVPKFTGGDVISLSWCNNDTLDLSAPMTILDSDATQTLTWFSITSPAHGLANLNATGISTGGVVSPLGVYYVPTSGYVGNDSFKVVVFDGNYYDTSLIVVKVDGAPNAGVVSGKDSVCPRDTIHLSSTQSGGSWYVTHPSIATVTTATGVVMGITAGYDTIQYVYANACGFDITYYPIYVRNDSANCLTEIHQFATNETLISIYPNPSNGQFSIQMSNPTLNTINIEIRDIFGRTILKRILQSDKIHDFDMNLPSGIYVLYVHDGFQTLTKKIAVNN